MKNSFKKLICFLLAILFAVVPSGNIRAEENNWLPVPLSVAETSNHLYYKIENSVLTFKDIGDPSLTDYGKLPDYSNKSRDNPTDYTITEWFQRKVNITKVVFEESISYIGSYVLTNMDKVTEIVIENPNVETSKNAVLFSTTKRPEPLNIFAPSTIKTVDYWIRGSGNRKITDAISEPTMYFTDFEEHIGNLIKLEKSLTNNQEIDPELFCDMLILLKNVFSSKDYNISDYRKAIYGAENIIELIKKELSGKCGENLEYMVIPKEKSAFELVITGSGDMFEYGSNEEVPWKNFSSYITVVSVSDSVTSLSEKAFDKNVTFRISVNSFAYSFVKENEFDYKIEKLRILLIGNSHTMDYSEFLPNIIADMNDSGLETEIVITKSTIGSIGLYSGRNSNVNAVYRSHTDAIKNQSGAYSNLVGNRFDLIIVQDYMESVVDDPETFKSGLSGFIEIIKNLVFENGQGEPEIAWFADWVDIRSCGGDTSLRDGEGNKIRLDKRTREEVYRNSLDNIEIVEKAIKNNEKNMPDFVIQGSTIKQNGMSSYLGTTVNFGEKYCLLERDTTHLTCELGRYLLGSGVMATLSGYYGSAFTADENSIDVSSSLTLENKPEATGEGSQYSGTMTEALLSVVQESAANYNTFVHSEYIIDPVYEAFELLKNQKWNTSEITDELSAQNLITKQISGILDMDFDILSTEITNFVSSGIFDVSVVIRYGYSIGQTVIEIRNYPLADLNLDGKVDVMDAYTARLVAAKLIKPTDEQLAVGDVDLDGKITAIDANIIRKYSVGIIKSLPVQ